MREDVRVQRVGEVVEAVREALAKGALRHGEVLEVPGHGDGGEVAGAPVDADDDHRVGAQAPPVRSCVAAEEQDVPPPAGGNVVAGLVVDGRVLDGGAGMPGRHRRRRVEAGSVVAADVEAGAVVAGSVVMPRSPSSLGCATCTSSDPENTVSRKVSWRCAAHTPATPAAARRR